MNEDTRTDQAMIEAFVNRGDQSCFSEIVQRHAPMVFRVCFRVLGNHHDAEDATQAVFAVLIKKAGSIRKKQSLASWLHGVARATSLYRLRTEARRRKREEDAAMSESDSEPTITDENRAHVLTLVDEALARLSGVQREAVVLRFLEGHSVEAAASLLGCQAEVLKSRTRHAMAKLRSLLSRRGVTIGTAMLATILASEANAAIPPAFISSVAAGASAIAAGTAVGTVSGSAITLTEGVLKMYTVMKVKMIGLYAAAVISVGIGVGTLAEIVYHKDVQVIGAGAFQSSMEIRSVCISPDSRFLATGYAPRHGEKGAVSIWDIASMRQVMRIPVDGSVFDMTYDSSGNHLYLLSEKRLLAWDIEKNILLFEQNLPNRPLRLSLNDKKRAVCVVTGPDIIDEHDVELNKLIQEKQLPPYPFPPSYEHRSENIVAFDMNTGEKLKSWDGLARTNEVERFEISGLSCSSDGAKLLAADTWAGGRHRVWDNQITILDWDTGKVLSKWILDRKRGDLLDRVVWLPGDDRILVRGWKSTTIIDVASGKTLHQFPKDCLLNRDKTQILCMTNDMIVAYSAKTFERVNGEGIPARGMKLDVSPVLSPDGHWLVASTYGSQIPFVFDMVAKQLKSPGPDAFRKTPYMWYLPDGRCLASDEEWLRVFNEKGKEICASKILIKPDKVRSMGPEGPFYLDYTEDPDGRFLLRHVENGVQLWDTVLGQPAKERAVHPGKVVYASVAPNLMYAATVAGDRFKIHDLNTGLVLSEFLSPTKEYSGKMFWDMARQRIVMGGDNAAGIIDMRTGERLYQFVNEAGTPAVKLELRAIGPDIVYGSAYFEKKEGTTIVIWGDKSKQTAPPSNCLWRLSDGGFLRYIPNVGATACSSEESFSIKVTYGDKSETINSSDIYDTTPPWHGGEDVRFSEDGKRLYGPLGIVDVETGAILRKHKKQLMYSPSYTLATDIDSQSRLNIFDADSGILIWQQPLLKNPGEVSIRRLIWHPAESHVALSINEGAPLLQVELFQPMDYPKNLTMQQALDMLADEDIQKRMMAASFLRAQGRAAIAGLQQCCGTKSEPATQKSAIATLVLEQLARKGLAAARKALEKIETAQAQGAIKRLDVFGHVQTLRKKHESSDKVRKEEN